ncbi:MAG: NAD(P)H-dependent flavin oxidoreductase [Acidimicrobiales bacterium]
MIRSRFTEMFDLAHPVMSAPMALHSGGTLAGAVSAAGALGSFGAVHPSKGPEWIRAEVATIRAMTDRPFAVGFITGFLPFVEPLFEAVLSEEPAAVALSFGDPGPWISRCKAVGSRVICQVQNYEHAELAVTGGADVLVAQGTEAGGHTGTMSLLPFLAGVVARYPDVPVLAAGGIADGRTLAAALTAGADGAWLGTAFLATPEAVEVHATHKNLIVQSDGTDTVFTRAYDIVSGYPWPEEIGERVRRNRFTDEWNDKEAELRSSRSQFEPPDPSDPFGAPPDPETSEVLYGQSAGFVDAVRPAAQVVSTISDDAERILRTRPGSLLR